MTDNYSESQLGITSMHHYTDTKDEVQFSPPESSSRWSKIFKDDKDAAWVDVFYDPTLSGLGKSRGSYSSDESSPLTEHKEDGKAKLSTVVHIRECSNISPTVFIIRFSSNSNSRLSLSETLFNELMEQYSITPRMREHMMCYGFREKELDFVPPGPRFKVTDCRVLHDLQDFEIVYGFRYMVKVADVRCGDGRWAARQSTVYQKFDYTLDKNVWILIAPSEETESYTQRYLEAISNIKSGNFSRHGVGDTLHEGIIQAFATHVLLIEASMANWRWYIEDLMSKVHAQSDHVSLADVLPGGKDGRGHEPLLKVEFSKRQELKQLEDHILKLRTMLKGLVETILTLRKHICCYSTQLGLTSATNLEISFTELYKDARMHLIKSDYLYRRIKRVANLLSDLLLYENTTALKDIAQESKEDNKHIRYLTVQASEDSKSIKVITVITVFFLPATVVAVCNLYLSFSST